MAATGYFLNNAVTPLVLLRDEFELGRATGFLLKLDDHWNIVTNWHVLSGCDPTTGQSRSATGAVPNYCRFYKAEGGGVRGWEEITVPLGDALSGEGATWFQHPTAGQKIDIATLPLEERHLGDVRRDLLDATGHDPDMFVDLGGELFLPGYPLGLRGGGYYPIWKRASLATSLEATPGLTTFFLVDTASREGMSGSPCLAISNWQHYRLDRQTGKMSVIKTPLSWRLLGVYSGRLNARDDLGAQLGMVWREDRIFEVIRGGSRGTVRINP